MHGDRTASGHSPVRKTRRRIWIYGIVIVIAIASSAVLRDAPLQAGRVESREVGADADAQEQVANFRTSLANWQLYLEPRVVRFIPSGSKLDPVDLAKGSTLAQ